MKIYIFFSLIAFSFQICREYICDNSTTQCITVSKEKNQIIFSECKEGEYCPIISDNPSKNYTCTKKETIYPKSYPGFPCEKNEDCFGPDSECNNRICTGKGYDDSCQSNADCLLEYVCIKGKCLRPKGSGASCQNDYECEKSYGCLDNKCTKYFSLDDNTEFPPGIYNDIVSFCKSGFSYNNTCRNLTRENKVNGNCDKDNPCVYFYYENGEKKNLTLKEMCVCGNKNSHCRVGSGERNFTRYVNTLKDYLNSSNCHPAEHGSPFGCMNDIKSENEEIRKKAAQLYNFYLWAFESPKMLNMPECVAKVQFPEYNPEYDEPEIFDDNGVCPKYSCVYENSVAALNKTCLVSNFNSQDDINVTIYYNKNPNHIYMCHVEDSKIFYRSETVGIVWQNKSDIRYPGEYCTSDAQCKLENHEGDPILGKCNERSNICSGYPVNSICETHDKCNKGLYCKKSNKKGRCRPQLSLGEKCRESFECQNNLICYNKTCRDELYKYKPGMKISASEIAETESEVFNGKMCIFEKFFRPEGETDYYCVSYSLDWGESKEEKYEDFKECKTDEDCVYNVNGVGDKKDLSVTLKCECSFSSEGKKYCPRDQKDFVYAWKDYAVIKRRLMKNNCHTLNRFDCYEWEIDDKFKGDYEMYKMYKNMLEKGHLFYKSEECAESVLGEKYILYNFLNILFLIFVYLIF